MAADDERDELVLKTQGEFASLSPGRERAVIRHLPYFVVLAEDGNFSRAALRLGISQSALTRRIQTLEQELGAPLFTRTQRSAVLTPAGEVFRKSTERILDDLRTAVRHTRLVSRGEAGEIHVALNEEAIRSAGVVAAFAEIRDRHPEVQIILHAMPSEAQLVAFRRKDIDLGLLYDVAVDPTARGYLELFKIAASPSSLAVNERHWLARKPQVWLADLRDEQLTWPSRSAGRSVGDGMITAFHGAGLSPNIALEVLSDETTLSMAAANLGLGFVRPTSRPPPNVVLRTVEDLTFQLALSAAWRRDADHSGVRRILAALKRQVDAENYASSASPGG